MNKKSFLITAILPILLVGCGGGDSGSSDNSPKPAQDNLDNGTRYYFVNYELDEGNGRDHLILEYSEILNRKFKQKYNNEQLGEYVLTAKKLYKPTDIQSNSITLNSLTSWTITLIDDIKTDIKLEKVNLSGKNIFDTLLPGYRSLGFDNENSYTEARKFLSSYGKETFPSGSTCYRFVSKKQNQEYYNFTTDYAYQQSFEEFDFKNQNIVDELNNHYKSLGWSYRYVSGVWQNIPWTNIYNIETGFANEDVNVVAVKYQNKTYLAEYNSDIEWTSAEEIKRWQNLLGRTTTDRERTPKLNIEKLKNGCQVYNQTAANALASLSMIRWNN